MARRSETKARRDEREFPIRLKFVMPLAGLREGGWRIERWLRDELGDHDYALHGAGHDFAVYFRRVDDAQRFSDAFPHLALADRIAALYGTKTPSRPVHETWHAIGNGPNG